MFLSAAQILSALNSGMVSKYRSVKNVEGNSHGPISGTVPYTPNELMQIVNHILSLNPGYSEYEAEVLATLTQHQVWQLSLCAHSALSVTGSQTDDSNSTLHLA